MLPDNLRVRLRELTARPYRVPLVSAASPSMIISRLDEHDHPGALWGGWFGGGVVIFSRPLLVANPPDAEGAFALLDELPELEPGPVSGDLGVIGGGWLACLGYDAGTDQLRVLRFPAALDSGGGMVLRESGTCRS